MSSVLVSRRIVGYTKGKPRAHKAPPPPQRASDELVGERAPPFAPMAGARPVPPRKWWHRALQPTTAVLAALACYGLIHALTGASAPAQPRQVDTAATAASVAAVAARRSARTSAYAGGATASEEVVLSDRSLPTDESFLATAYVRKKVSLPHISGNCVVTGSGSRDVGACLRRQMAQ